MCEVLVAGIDVECHSVDWSIHVPLMLHISVLGLDHSRPIVYQHCKRLLVHLLTVLGDHRDHHGIARVLLNVKTTTLGYKLVPHLAFQRPLQYTDSPPASHATTTEDAKRASAVPTDATSPSAARRNPTDEAQAKEASSANPTSGGTSTAEQSETTDVLTSLDSEVSDDEDVVGATVAQGTTTNTTPCKAPAEPVDHLQSNVKGIVDFIAAHEGQPLWSYEDITPKQLTIRSAQQLANFVQHVVTVSLALIYSIFAFKCTG